MLSYENSLKMVKETNALIQGHFILSSGLHSPQYVPWAQLLSKPFEAEKFCSSLADKILEEFKEIDLILSPAMGGVVIGYEIGRLLKKETIFSERVNGKFKLRRGFEISKGSKVLIVEDVITTGKSSLDCSELINSANAYLLGFACLIDRSNGKSKINKKIVSQVQIVIPSYKEDELPENLKLIPAIKPGSRDLKWVK